MHLHPIRHPCQVYKKLVDLIYLHTREAVRHLQDHVGAVEALWRMKFNASNVKQPATLPPMFSAMHVHFVRRGVKSVVGFHIPGSIPNQC